MELLFLKKQDPWFTKVLSRSTFSAVYEFDEALGQMQKLKIEGCLYLLERKTQPFYKMLILNRKSRTDFVDWLNSNTQFSEKDHFIAYTAVLQDNFKLRRTLYFTLIEDKVKFLTEANKAIDQLKSIHL